MYCKECGKQIADDSKFCRYCGTKQEHDNSSLAETISSNPKEINVNLSFNRKVKADSLKIEPAIQTSKYDESYERETVATIVGIILILANLILLLTNAYSVLADSSILPFVGIINLVWRIIVTVWVVNIARRQNRSTDGWGVFAFLIPNLALIIVGLLKKLKGNDDPIAEHPIYDDAIIENVEYKIVCEDKRTSIFTGKYTEFWVRFNNGDAGIFHFYNNKNYYSFRTRDKILSFSEKEECIHELHKYLINKNIEVSI